MRQDTDATRAVSRAISVLRCLSTSVSGRSAFELCQLARIPRASLYRILNALLQEELILQDAHSGKYLLGPASLHFGFYARAHTELVAQSLSLLREVARKTEQLAELVAPLPHWRILVLDTWHGRETPTTVAVRPGVMHFINTDYAPSEAVLCFGPERRLAEYMRLSQTPEHRRRCGLDGPLAAEYLERVERWRRLGYVWAAQSGAPGVGRVAAPVFDSRKNPPVLTAVLGIACASAILSAPRAAHFGAILKTHAAKLAARLAGGENQ